MDKLSTKHLLGNIDPFSPAFPTETKKPRLGKGGVRYCVMIPLQEDE
jgi:hypothetical protein